MAENHYIQMSLQGKVEEKDWARNGNKQEKKDIHNQMVNLVPFKGAAPPPVVVNSV